jgi:ABC-type phosphate transport system substrate-binding protein
MSLCINPQCPKPENSDELLFCRGCGSGLLLGNKYRVTKLMSEKGGLGSTYEMVEQWVPKILKILTSDNPRAIESCDREFRFLHETTGKDLVGIPHVENFFTYKPNGSPQVFHCLAIEKINGMNLADYLKIIDSSIDEKTAVGWLEQLTQILERIHDRHIFHRDIKPSNIILQPNGQLALIDLGIFKQIFNDLDEEANYNSSGYLIPVKKRSIGSPVQADYFALGRTFVYLLTRKKPIDLDDADRNILTWRNLTPNISSSFLDEIDRLMEENSSPHQNSRQPTIRQISLSAPTMIQQGITDVSTVPTPITPIPTPTSIPIPPPIPTTIPTLIPTTATSTPITIPTPIIIPPPITISTPTPSRANNNSSFKPLRSIPSNQDAAKVSIQSSGNNFARLLVKISIPVGLLLTTIIGWTWWNNQKSQIITITPAKETAGVFSQIKDVPTGTFNFGGSTTWATTRQPNVAMDSIIKGAFPGYNIEYVDNNSPNVNIRSISSGKCDKQIGSNTGICWLIQGDLDFAQSSVSLAKSKYADLAAANHLTEEAVAYDALTIVVNRELNIPGLTIEQLRGIYTGKITNWSQVNGPNLPIVTFSLGENSGNLYSFKNLVLQPGDQLKAKFVATNTEGLQKIKSGKNGIFYGSAKEVIVDSCLTQPIPIGRTVNTFKPYQEPLQPLSACLKGERNKINPEVIKNQAYPLTRKIYVIIKADGTARQKAGEAYVKLLKTQQGQDLLERAGFVRIAD